MNSEKGNLLCGKIYPEDQILFKPFPYRYPFHHEIALPYYWLPNILTYLNIFKECFTEIKTAYLTYFQGRTNENVTINNYLLLISNPIYFVIIVVI